MEKFLTVFAVFDDETQNKLKSLQNEVLKLGFVGTQTMDIPFHISLGSFPVEKEEELKEKIMQICKQEKAFDISLKSVNDFNNRVLFVEPETSAKLQNLHKIFDNNYADGFPWHAHATIFCDSEENVLKAKKELKQIFTPMNAKIVGVQMGEFFPTKMIIEEKLN